MAQEQKLVAAMIAMGFFILSIFIGIELFVFFCVPFWPMGLILLLISFPSKDRKEHWETMKIFIHTYRRYSHGQAQTQGRQEKANHLKRIQHHY